MKLTKTFATLLDGLSAAPCLMMIGESPASEWPMVVSGPAVRLNTLSKNNEMTMEPKPMWHKKKNVATNHGCILSWHVAHPFSVVFASLRSTHRCVFFVTSFFDFGDPQDRHHRQGRLALTKAHAFPHITITMFLFTTAVLVVCAAHPSQTN